MWQRLESHPWQSPTSTRGGLVQIGVTAPLPDGDTIEYEEFARSRGGLPKTTRRAVSIAGAGTAT